ncbi:NEDD8-specific protease 1-like [Silene latifolia]|uniref:NEDD8-specific protease 1-like n=1 Tax=Silene latifolia TaxID=37657 RepID=UPI003D7845A6
MIQYEDVVLQDLDIDTLQQGCFLADKVFAFYFAYLTSTNKTDDVLLVEPTVSIWLARCDQAEASSYAESYKLSTKSLVLFVVNDRDPYCEGDDGTHWSTLVYHRSMNSFIHFDTMKGMNHSAAMKLYEAVKSYMGAGGQAAKLQASKKKKDKKKNARSVCKPSLDVPVTAVAGMPVFRESEDIQQQSNGYDCGLYVLAIAEFICHWFINEMNNIIQDDLVSAVVKEVVDHSVECQMRDKVLGIIRKVGNQKQPN